jgi:hypothetical protein
MKKEELSKTIDKLSELRRQLVESFGDQIEFPECALALDFEPRKGSTERMVKHVHQLCLMHGLHFRYSNQIKLTYILDGFIDAAKNLNHFSAISCARLALELNAFLYRVQSELSTSACKDLVNWKPAGESFFSRITRARFGSSDPTRLLELNQAGLSKSSQKPFNITECVIGLTTTRTTKDSMERYSRLCDYVHHNRSSQAISNEGSYIGKHVA